MKCSGARSTLDVDIRRRHSNPFVAGRFNDDEATELLAVRAMVGSLVLFDHVDPRGAFHSGSPIQVPFARLLLPSLCLLIICTHVGADQAMCVALVHDGGNTP